MCIVGGDYMAFLSQETKQQSPKEGRGQGGRERSLSLLYFLNFPHHTIYFIYVFLILFKNVHLTKKLYKDDTYQVEEAKG